MSEKQEKKPTGGIDIREIFERGKGSNDPVVRGAAMVAEGLWNTGIILGNAIADVPETREDKKE